MLVVQQNWVRYPICCSLSLRVANIHIHVCFSFNAGYWNIKPDHSRCPLELMVCLCVTSVASKRKQSWQRISSSGIFRRGKSPIGRFLQKPKPKSSPDWEPPLLKLQVAQRRMIFIFQLLLQQQLWVKQWLWCAQGTKPENLRQRAQMQNFLQ